LSHADLCRLGRLRRSHARCCSPRRESEESSIVARRSSDASRVCDVCVLDTESCVPLERHGRVGFKRRVHDRARRSLRSHSFSRAREKETFRGLGHAVGSRDPTPRAGSCGISAALPHHGAGRTRCDPRCVPMRRVYARGAQLRGTDSCLRAAAAAARHLAAHARSVRHTLCRHFCKGSVILPSFQTTHHRPDIEHTAHETRGTLRRDGSRSRRSHKRRG
jgi:hypothetical protein